LLAVGAAVKKIAKKVGQDRAGQIAEEELAVLRSGKPLSARLSWKPALIALIQKHLDQYECQYGRRAESEGWLTRCSRGKLHLDHIRPLSRQGRNTLDNFQFLCATHNTKKSNDKEDVFFIKMGEERDTKAREKRDKQFEKDKRAEVIKAKKAQASQAKAIAARAKGGAAPARKPRPPKKSGGFLGGLFG
jgi:hypothetical protein